EPGLPLVRASLCPPRGGASRTVSSPGHGRLGKGPGSGSDSSPWIRVSSVIQRPCLPWVLIKSPLNRCTVAIVVCNAGRSGWLKRCNEPRALPAEAARRMADDEGYPPARQRVARWASGTLSGLAQGLMVPSGRTLPTDLAGKLARHRPREGGSLQRAT